MPTITITDSPANPIVPLYNPFYYVVDSTNSTKRNFKYIFDLSYSKGTGAPISIGRFKVYPNPNDNQGYFTPHSIFQNYVDNMEHHPLIQSLVANDGSYVYCYLSIGEEYDDSPLSAATGTTIYPDIITTSIIGLNSIFQSNQVPDLSNYDFGSGAALKYFLSNWNLDYGNKNIYFNEWETISAVQNSPISGIFYVDYWTYNATGGTIGHYRYTNSLSSLKIEIPSGTQNLYLMTANNLLGGGVRKIVDTDVSSYIVYINDTIDNSYGFRYIINPLCERFEKFRICWLNSLGGFDYYTFNLMKRDYLKVNRGDWDKKIGYGYQIGDRGKTINYVNGDQSIVVTTDWLTNQENNFIQNLFTSPSIYYIDSQYNLIPLILQSSDFELKKLVNDDIVNYTLEFQTAHKKYGQNG